ncbi:MAG: SBBP repeat-containing protein, partial [Flavobacteriales bacterium]
MRNLTLLSFLSLATVGLATTPPVAPAALANSSVAPAGFEENKGQVRTTGGDAAPFVRYRLSQGNTQLFLLENGIAYQFSRIHYPDGYAELKADARHDSKKQGQLDAMREQVRLETYRMDMMLDGADTKAQITTEGRSEDYTQYYNHDVLDVRTYTKVTYHEIYPGIDWVVYTTEKGMKYDFVVRPGADPNQIRMRFEHHEELSLDADGNLIHGNRMGRLTEERPVSFQDGKEIATRFALDGDRLRFVMDRYDHSKSLTIDPDLIWGTYYGGGGFEEGTDCATSATGDVALAGWSDSNTGIASGGYQNAFGGGNADAFLAVFNSNGVRLWATYYGGTSNEVGHGCAFDASGNVYLCGYTESASGIASGGHQGTYGGATDVFLVKFNSSGTRQWGTYYGGSDWDDRAHCATDPSGNVFLSGLTSSSTGIASGGHQNTFGGAIDGFLAKFNANGNRQWGTYYGGSGDEIKNECTADVNGNVYLAGETSSSTGIASGGFLNTYAGGDRDLYLAKFNSSGNRLWATYYGGAGTESDGSCATDASGNVYLAGTTQSPSGIASGGHQNSYGGGMLADLGDGLLVKFSSSGARLWATYYGGSGLENGTGCAVDGLGNVYLVGETQNSTSGIAFDGYQSTYAGQNDAYLVKFDPSGTRQWGTYYGGPNTEYAGGCSAGEEEMVYIAGTTTSSSGIAYNGHQNSSSNQAAYLAKFGLYIPPSITTATVPGYPFCVGEHLTIPFTIEGTFNAGNVFTAELSDAAGSFSTPSTIGTVNGTTNGTITATIPGGSQAGTGYRIRVIGSDPATIGSDNGSNLIINDNNASCACATPMESEPNNSTSTPNALAYATPMSGLLGPCSVADNSSDHFSFTSSGQGNLRVQACLSNTGPVPLNVTFRVLNSAGTTLGTFTLPAGANNTTVAGEFLFPCRGAASYLIAVDNPSTTLCTHYAFSYTILPPVFGNDPEPNDGIGASATPVAYNTDRDGRNNFDLESTYDYYSIILPTNGILNIETQAEHVGASPSTMAVALVSTVGIVLQTWNVAVGANGIPAASAVSITCRSTVSTYYIRINSAACGTSYRFKYTVTPPLFAGDAEPNNGTPGTPAAHDTYMTGNLQFDGESTYDYFNIVPPTNGVMTLEVQAENVSGTPGTIDVVLLTAVGTTIQTWSVAVGANSIAATTTVSIPCRSNTTNYNLRFATTTCGVSYRWKYTMTAPLFANDVEPNQTYGGSTEAYDTWYEGQIGFDNQTDDDIYNLVPPFNGVMNIEVEVEHTGASPGTVTVALVNTVGSTIQSWTMTVGANGVPLDTLVSVTCRSSITDYDLRFSDVTCGVSYRWKYTMAAPVFAADAEPNNSQPGTALAPDTYTQGQLAFDAESTYDYYRIVPSANGKVNVELQAEHTGAVPGTISLLLLNTAGTVLQTWSFPVGASGVPITTVLSKTCITGGLAYDLRLSSSVCGTSYKLKYTLTPPVFSNDVEPNNSTSQAVVLVEAQPAQGQLNVAGGDNLDYYRANLTGDGVLNVNVEAEHAGVETNATVTVVLLVSTGTVLQTWTVPVGANAIPISTVVSETCRGAFSYYLKISSTICGTSYRLTYTVTPPLFAADTEPNNTPTQANLLVVGQPAAGHVNFYSADNIDYHRINLSGDGILNVNVEAEHAGVETDGTMTVILIVSTGTVLGTWSVPVGAGSVPISTVVSETCRGAFSYYLKISSTICGTSYRLTYTVTPPVFAADTEPNNGTSQANLLVEGQPSDGHVNFYSGDNIDYHRIDLSADGILNVNVEAEHADVSTAGALQVELLVSTGLVLRTWTVAVGANSVPISTLVSETCRGTLVPYYLRVSSNICGTSYHLTYTLTPPVFAQDVEPNNTPTQSIVLPATQTTQGHLNFYSADNLDEYRLNMPTDGVLHIAFEAEHVDASTTETVQLELRTSTSALLQTWIAPIGANSIAVSSTHDLTCRGTVIPYYLHVVSNGCGVSYRVSYTVTPPLFNGDAEPNNSTPGTAMDLNAGEQQGHIGFHNTTDDDYYAFTHPGGPWSITVSAEHAGTGAGTMTLVVINNPGTVFGTFTVPVGGSSSALTNTFTIPSLPAGTIYRVKLSDVTCGVSYRIHCYDDDGDGTCNGSDLCAGGPEPGTPCNDGNSATIN